MGKKHYSKSSSSLLTPTSLTPHVTYRRHQQDPNRTGLSPGASALGRSGELRRSEGPGPESITRAWIRPGSTCQPCGLGQSRHLLTLVSSSINEDRRLPHGTRLPHSFGHAVDTNWQPPLAFPGSQRGVSYIVSSKAAVQKHWRSLGYIVSGL